MRHPPGILLAAVMLIPGAGSLLAQQPPDLPSVTVRGQTYTPRSILSRNMGTEEDLQRCGYVPELRERAGSLIVVAAQSGDDDGEGAVRSVQARIDRSWAMQILAGAMSLLEALGRTPGSPASKLLKNIRTTIGGRKLRRLDSHVAGQTTVEGREHGATDDSSAREAATTIRETGRGNAGEFYIMRRR